ncbi:hypothetical protein EDB83DRAFT_2514176 [Lactarius deliciosus]|nr:hypothetical protein EDB83DRAFT_2514176 [Lactarius deliciosus]
MTVHIELLSALEELCILALPAHFSRGSRMVNGARKCYSSRPDDMVASNSNNASLTTRASLDSSKHALVDAFLKSLKLPTRKLTALLAQHATELIVLERIYYINNNQHRAVLF